MKDPITERIVRRAAANALRQAAVNPPSGNTDEVMAEIQNRLADKLEAGAPLSQIKRILQRFLGIRDIEVGVPRRTEGEGRRIEVTVVIKDPQN